MLRSFSKHFNDTVFRGPDMEGGSGDTIPENDIADGGDVGHPDGGDDSGAVDDQPQDRQLTVREQIKKSIAETSEQPQAKPKRDAKTGRFGDRVKPDQEPVAQEQQPAAKSTVPAPESLSKEAKAAWASAPPAIQEAFVKREQDMQKGVDELKQKYSLIDGALAEHTDALRQMNATPGEAVNRMFLWFKALANNPVQAIPGLVQSMGMDWNKVVAAIAQGQQGQNQPQSQQQGAPEIPEPVRNYVGTLENQVRELTNMVQQVQSGFGNIQQDIVRQSEAKTQENLNLWSKDKQYFEEVRQDMARLIQADPALVKNGQVDLDTAYERAIYYNPEVRAKVLAAQQQANQQVQQTADAATTAQRSQQATKARKAAVSLPSSGSPGAPAAKPGAKKVPGQKTSVRESLTQAMRELADQ